MKRACDKLWVALEMYHYCEVMLEESDDWFLAFSQRGLSGRRWPWSKTKPLPPRWAPHEGIHRCHCGAVHP